MSRKYCYNGYEGGYIISDDPQEPEPEVTCELCFEPCTDNFIVVDITASLSIIVCKECAKGDPVEYESILEFVKHKKLKSWKKS